MGPAKRAPKSPLAERKSSAANGLNGRKNPAAPNALVLLPPLFSGQKFFRNGPGPFGRLRTGRPVTAPKVEIAGVCACLCMH
jgi:hypothetical protein